MFVLFKSSFLNRALVMVSILQVLIINETWVSRTFCSKFQNFPDWMKKVTDVIHVYVRVRL